MWHASLAILGRRGPIPAEHWAFKQLTKARGRLMALLAGVGTGEDHWQTTEVTLHLRRRLTEGELARIDPAWLALPAIDGA